MADIVLEHPETLDTNKAIALSLGMTSPLWLAFTGAAVIGSTFWWMSRWAHPENLEALFDRPPLDGSAPVAPSAIAQNTVAVVSPVAEIAATAAQTVVQIAAKETVAMVEGLAQVDPVVEPLPTASAAPVADDLTKLVGVGPRLAASLAQLGVTSFAQIAAWTEADLAQFDSALALKGRAGRDAWIAQARRLAGA